MSVSAGILSPLMIVFVRLEKALVETTHQMHCALAYPNDPPPATVSFWMLLVSLPVVNLCVLLAYLVMLMPFHFVYWGVIKYIFHWGKIHEIVHPEQDQDGIGLPGWSVGFSSAEL